jgi:hypothetical protein
MMTQHLNYGFGENEADKYCPDAELGLIRSWPVPSLKLKDKEIKEF